MAVVIVTGSAGLIGSESVAHFADLGFEVVGIDNDFRSRFFGADASTTWNRRSLETRFPKQYTHYDVDIRDADAINGIFEKYKGSIDLVIHAAAQPSHDWAASDPQMDFTVNANGTLAMLEATRKYALTVPFIFTSTNKVYGDTPNTLPLVELESRWELPSNHPDYAGIAESMSVDQSKHSLFGASKLAADVLVQEYGRYFSMPTAIFRGGCLTGPNHSGTKLHGFLAYLMKCAATGEQYTVFGYKGKQVRDNIHSADLVAAFEEVYHAPRVGEVYNIGGARHSNCSMLEAIGICESITGRPVNWTYSETNRIGDHIWYISDVSKFKAHYPRWEHRHNLHSLLTEIYEKNVDRWSTGSAAPVAN
jgi:CDP-paratose 2-epimerase